VLLLDLVPRLTLPVVAPPLPDVVELIEKRALLVVGLSPILSEFACCTLEEQELQQ